MPRRRINSRSLLPPALPGPRLPLPRVYTAQPHPLSLLPEFSVTIEQPARPPPMDFSTRWAASGGALVAALRDREVQMQALLAAPLRETLPGCQHPKLPPPTV